MLGSLARKLRLLGFDTVYVKDAADSELKYMVRSQGRILLTRDRSLAKNLGDLAWHVKGGNVREEFISIAGMLADIGCRTDPFSRCLNCNETLNFIHPSQAEGRVPPYIQASHENFSGCRSCGKVFWAGTHRTRMEEDVEWMRGVLEEEKRRIPEEEKR
jgi:hypothetical protein